MRKGFTLAEVLKLFPRPFGERVRVRGFRAFTLSEVLITLGVIGVVSAMTLPSVIKNYQKHVTETKLKKAYTQLSEAVKLSEVQNGSTQEWDFNLNSDQFSKKYLTPFIKIRNQKANVVYNKLQYKCMNGTNGLVNDVYKGTNTNVFTLTDGSLLFVDQWIESNVKYINIDINGESKPNVNGKDLFDFVITNTGLKTVGYSLNDTTIKNKCYSKGDSCSTLIMQNGWKIPKDYPW